MSGVQSYPAADACRQDSNAGRPAEKARRRIGYPLAAIMATSNVDKGLRRTARSGLRVSIRGQER